MLARGSAPVPAETRHHAVSWRGRTSSADSGRGSTSSDGSPMAALRSRSLSRSRSPRTSGGCRSTGCTTRAPARCATAAAAQPAFAGVLSTARAVLGLSVHLDRAALREKVTPAR
ncbi:hypothetical protein NKG05_24930 [Oerskovia sp. M15]